MISFVLREVARIVALVVVLVLGAGCASDRQPRHARSSRVQPAGQIRGDSYSRSVETRLWDEYNAWKGTRHTMGGTGRSGVDCSAFVQAVYRNVFNMQLPRTTKDQVLKGISVARHELQPGDLVFFRPPSYSRHVGIYLSRDAFLHASKTKGVTISKMDPHYWGRYYWTARRLFP